jgi:hypothetical protein
MHLKSPEVDSDMRRDTLRSDSGLMAWKIKIMVLWNGTSCSLEEPDADGGVLSSEVRVPINQDTRITSQSTVNLAMRASILLSTG